MNNEPIALTTLIKESISSGIKLLVVLGLIVIDEVQLAILLLFVDNFLALGAAIYTRSKSTATANPNLAVGTSVNQGSAVVASVDPPPPPTAPAP